VKLIKDMVLVLLVLAFTMNSYAVASMVLCNCAEMAQSEITHAEMSDKKIPCHEMAETDTDKASMDMERANDQTNQDQESSTECNKCSCGHCNFPTQASLLSDKAVNDHLSKDLKHLMDDVGESIYLYGIQYPPERIS